ncbi:substrate-binding domain-containing protein [Ketogulonicigenium robustum]|nr:substrate-binding domain-containing protein [Ketogulonicigenium robustum]
MTLKEFSAILGLSPTTVSRALNGYPEVNEATRSRIAAEAKRLNYRANARALRLATGRAMAVGHVIPIAPRHEIMNPVFADFIAGAGEIYSAQDYEMILSVVSDADEEISYRALKSRGSVDGVIVHGPSVDDRRIPLLRELAMPFVVHGRASDIAQPYAWVDVNNRRAFQRATGFLLDLGHRRIALLNGLEFMDFAMRRRRGYTEALAARGIVPDPSLMSSHEMTEAAGYRAAMQMLALPLPPTAFLASSIILGFGIRRALDDCGLKMGRDVSVIVHDDDLSYLTNGDDVPIFTATRSSVRAAGRAAAELLLQQIASPADPLPNRLLEAELIIGQSTGPLLGRPA